MTASGWLDSTFDWLGETLRNLGAIDGICLILLIFFAVRGFSKGFLRQAALVAGVLTGCTLSRLFAHDLAQKLPTLYSELDGANAVFAAYFLIFVGTFVALGLFVRVLRSTLEAYRLESLDGLLGLASGALFGALIASMGLVAVLMFTPKIGPGEAIHDQIRKSRALRVVAHTIPHLGEVLPSEFVERGQEIIAAHDEPKEPPTTEPHAATPDPEADPFLAPQRELDRLEERLFRPDSGVLNREGEIWEAVPSSAEKGSADGRRSSRKDKENLQPRDPLRR